MKLGIKIFAVCSALTMIAPMAFGATNAELQTQITNLLAQIQNLQNQLTTSTGTTTTTTTTTFTSSLTVGSRGAEVTALQSFLISSNKGVRAQALAAVGATGYFGVLTQAAVAEYQAAVGISPAVGYFGPITRAFVNSITTTNTTNTTTTTTTTTNYSAGCTSAVGYSPTTGQLCSAVVTYTAGCTSAVGYSPTTGQLCVAATSTSTSVIPVIAEGSFTATLSATPAANANATTGVNVPVYGIDVRASGSNIKIDRLDLQLSVVNGATVYNPSSFITKISVLDGSTVLASKTITAADINQDATSIYWTRLTGLNFVVPKDTTKTLTVTFDTVGAIDLARTVTVNVYGNQGIRGVDGIGLSTYSALAATKVNIFTAGGASVLTITANSANPLAGNVVFNTTSGVTDVPMLAIDAKATIDNAIIKTIVVKQAYGTTTASTINLYDGSLKVGSVVAASGTSIFTNLAISVPKDTTKTLLVKVDFPAVTVGQVASIAIDKDEVLFARANGTTASATIAADIAGNEMHMYSASPIITLISATATKSGGGTTASSTLATTIVLKLKVQGGTLVAPNGIVASAGASTTVAIVDTLGVELRAASGTSGFAVALSPVQATYTDGQEVLMTISGSTLYNGPTTNVKTPTFLRMVLASLAWKITGQDEVVQNWGLTDFVTPYVSLP